VRLRARTIDQSHLSIDGMDLPMSCFSVRPNDEFACACVRVSECAHHCGVPASAMKVHSYIVNGRIPHSHWLQAGGHHGPPPPAARATAAVVVRRVRAVRQHVRERCQPVLATAEDVGWGIGNLNIPHGPKGWLCLLLLAN
jgi:hypothetical protein